MSNSAQVDFAAINEESTLVNGNTGSGGSFKVEPPVAGVALLRLREVIEFGENYSEKYEKTQSPVRLVFELVHPRHAITKEDGTFIRNHEVTVNLPSKSFNEKAKYFKLFNKLNYDGAVATPKGKVPAFNQFLNKPFLGEITLNENNGKVYANLDKEGEFKIGAPKTPIIDETTGAPTGDFRDITVPEMAGTIRCFLWETGVTDAEYTAMWNSIEISGEKNDGTPFKNWIQESILSEDNIALPGSRAEALFGKAAALDLSEPVDDIPFEADAPAAADPLAALGL